MAGSKVNQLRFDISEKVRLHPQQPGIGTLLELDLYPDVEIEDQETHLKIQGYLRLNGTYQPEQEFDTHPNGSEEPQEEQRDTQPAEIAYVIPVEITLPTERVDLENIASEIESFDYKVLSPFELQIEALLTIDGFIQETEEKVEEEPLETVPSQVATFTVPSEGEIQWDQDSIGDYKGEQDEYEFVHVARLEEESPEEAELSNQEEDVPAEPESFHEQDDTETQEEKKVEPAPEEADGQVEKIGEEEGDADAPPVHFHPFQPKQDRQEVLPFPRPLRMPQVGEFDLQQLEIDERTRFGIERMFEETEDHTPQQEEPSAESDDYTDDYGTEDAQEEEKNKNSNLEWAQWILNEEQDRFVKLRMVIVHKNDSIDSLSDRYKIPASKIVHLNRLESEVLEEGQVVYIPSK
ncbi:LysM peptidoglycan-binding domain-containing protein [Desmospora activa]|uniref:Stage VI sporulation protein D n=1 Tax=Desmospora activa DSM 45169 TaxID=1121389 RepID=A0A2T4Z8M8_9BACL|nr:LysM peptidoglycan-binding domain-containing protein [Desmospora activa]PTM58246.1 stage VI sporulation protein D [Desmospora activa DSM 45169]